jgi:uncharacterized membrane protein YccC
MLIINLLVVAALVVAYITPTIIALCRNHPQAEALTAVNVLLGWTVIAWALCLAWALWQPQSSPMDHERIET